MIRVILSLLLVAFLTNCHSRSDNPTSLSAGNSTGNGGGGWVCRDSYGKVLWSELIDLFEAQNSFSLELGHSNGSRVDMANAAIAKMMYRNSEWKYPPGWWEKMEEVYRWLSKTEYLEEGAKNITFTNANLEIIDDALYFVIPRQDSCKNGQLRYEQFVHYLKDGRILVQRELFQSLSEISKAALIVHEAIYAWQRSEGALDSVNTRQIVGQLFSNWSGEAIVSSLLGLYSAYELPFRPGPYDVSMISFDLLGNRTPIADQTISIQTRQCFDTLNRNCGPRHNANGATDLRGIFTAELGEGNGSWTKPTLQFDFRGHTFSGTLQLNGWAMQLQSRFSGQSTVWCEAFISDHPMFSKPGEIRIICAERKC